MNELEEKLYNAVIENDVDTLSKLLKENSININFKTETGDTMLHLAKSEKVVEILMTSGIDYTIQNNEGMTAFGKHFHRVYIKSSEEILLNMIKAGVDINAPAYFNEAPIIKISNNATTLSVNIEQLQFLIENGANINIKNIQGYTPLMLAIIRNNIDMVQALLDAGADISIKDNSGRTAKDIGISLIESGYFIPSLKAIINNM